MISLKNFAKSLPALLVVGLEIALFIYLSNLGWNNNAIETYLLSLGASLYWAGWMYSIILE